ncbi:hypothetical protein GGI07_001818 [Coemansia sp. Benny D115]|nr:hypothetical protein GGI07_001818 [Coemansia sp. Benny D115]
MLDEFDNSPQMDPVTDTGAVEYEYETEEFYVVASLPANALMRARYAANNQDMPAEARRRGKPTPKSNPPKSLDGRFGMEYGSGGGVIDAEAEKDTERETKDAEDDDDDEYNEQRDVDAAETDANVRTGATHEMLAANYKLANYALIDIDTDRPMMEIEGVIYQGVWDELLGTHMLFDVEGGSESAELVASTSKTLVFHPVRINKKAQQSTPRPPPPPSAGNDAPAPSIAADTADTATDAPVGAETVDGDNNDSKENR